VNTPETVARSSRILCVDDNQDAADSTAQLLKAHGHDARACYNGPAALRVAAAFLPDVCFIDLNMPGMDGDVLAVELRKAAGPRPLTLVALTAMSDICHILRTEAAGFAQYLVKPADPAVLVEIAAGKMPAACDP